MAIYTTVERVRNQIRFMGSVSNVASGTIDQFIVENESVIDAKLSNLYAVPFGVNSVPPVIQTIATKVSAITLFDHIGIEERDTKQLHIERLEKFWELLGKIADGSLTIVDSSGTEVSQSTANINILSTNKDFKPVFDMRDAEDWRVDPDLIDLENSLDS
jgi:hypothetical protein